MSSSTIVLVSLDYAATLDQLHVLFSGYGVVYRIVAVQSHRLHSLVEFESAQQADNAVRKLSQLEGCSAKISRLKPPLQVRPGALDARDYTEKWKDPMESIWNEPIPNGTKINTAGEMLSMRMYETLKTNTDQMTGPGPGPMPMPVPMPLPLPLPLSMPMPRPIMMVQPTPYQEDQISNIYKISSPERRNMEKYMQINERRMISQKDGIRQQEAASWEERGAAELRQIETNVVRVTPISETTTHDELFLLLGVYGDVLRVAIPDKNDAPQGKQRYALVELTTPYQATLAIRYLDKLELRGQSMRLEERTAEDIDAIAKTNKEFVRMYYNSAAHRFNIPASKNSRHICAPSQSLHVSNLPEDVQEEEVYTLFNTEQFPVLSVNLFGTEPRMMAFIKMMSVEAAVETLLAFHGRPLRGRNVKLTFSHRPENDWYSPKRMSSLWIEEMPVHFGNSLMLPVQ